MAGILNENIDSLANILMQRRQMDAQQVQQDRANRLSDLQFKQLQREDDYQTGLRNAMTNPGGYGVTLSQLQPPQPQQNTLASLAPGNQLPFPQPQASFAPIEAKMSPSRAGAEYALGQGKIEDAVKLFSVDDHVAQLKAKGDLQGHYQAQMELEAGNKFFDIIDKFKTRPQQLKALWPQVQRMFPQQSEGITPDSIKFNSDYTVLPLVMNGQTVPGKGILRDSEGKTSVIDTTTKPDQEAMLDKRFANQQKLTQMQIDAQDRRATADRAAADRRATQKENGPGKVLPAGQLESVADMKRVKDVLAEANDVMSTGKVSTGPLAGRGQSLASKVGLADDSFVDLQQKLQTAQNIMLKLRSGAAVTESEYARFLKEYPTPNDTAQVFKRKMQNTLNYANTLMDDKMQIYEEGGYRVPQSVKSGNKASKVAPKSNAGPKPMVTKGGFKVTVVK